MKKLKARWWMTLTSVTILVSPLAMLASVAISLSNAGFVDPYWLDLSSKSTVSMLLLAPGFAALSAWDAARWRALMQGSVRTWVGLLGRHLAMVATLSTLTFLLTLAILATRTPPATGVPRVDVLAVGVLMTTAYAGVGFGVGRFLPRLIAAPAAFIMVWLWVAYTPAIQPFWLRNVTGNLGTSCCSLDQQLVAGALLAPGLLGITLIGAIVFVLAWPRHGAAWIGSVVSIAIGLAISGSLVSSVGADPVERRQGAQHCEKSGSTSLCAWPEHRGDLDNAAPLIATAADRLRAAGLAVPTTLHESNPVDGWSYSLMSTDPEVWRRAFATSPLDGLPPACTNENGGYWPAGEHLQLATSWLLVKAGAGTPEEEAQASDIEVGLLRSLLAKPKRAQAEWFTSIAAAMNTCNPIR